MFFSMPRIDDMLDQLEGRNVFSTLDARTGYRTQPWMLCFSSVVKPLPLTLINFSNISFLASITNSNPPLPIQHNSCSLPLIASFVIPSGKPRPSIHSTSASASPTSSSDSTKWSSSSGYVVSMTFTMVCWKQLNWGKTSTESWEFHIIKIIYIVDLVSFQSLRHFLFINLHSV